MSEDVSATMRVGVTVILVAGSNCFKPYGNE